MEESNKRDMLRVLSVENFTEVRTVFENTNAKNLTLSQPKQPPKMPLRISMALSNKLKVYKKKLNKSWMQVLCDKKGLG